MRMTMADVIQSKIQGKELQYLLVLTIIPAATFTKLVPKIRNVLKCHSERRRLRQIACSKTNTNRGEEGTASEGKITVSGIYIHPVKSLRPVSVTTANLTSLGLEGDRRLMLVRPSSSSTSSKYDPNAPSHRFVTQRQCASLATIVASLPVDMTSSNKTIIKLSSGKQSSKVYIDVSNKALKSYPIRYRARLWDDVVDVVDVGDEAASFVQAVMKPSSSSSSSSQNNEEEEIEDIFNDVRVVSMIPKVTNRKTDERYVPNAALNPLSGTVPNVSLTDGFPILVASEESLGELNRRLKQKGKHSLPMSRFRPNIVLKGLSSAFEEDTFKAIQIGGPSGPIVHLVKGCPRCKQSCTDQLTGKRDVEPLETLKEFRALGNNEEDVYFAQNAILQPFFSDEGSKGTIHVGDTVTVLTKGLPVWDIDTVQAE